MKGETSDGGDQVLPLVVPPPLDQLPGEGEGLVEAGGVLGQGVQGLGAGHAGDQVQLPHHPLGLLLLEVQVFSQILGVETHEQDPVSVRVIPGH